MTWNVVLSNRAERALSRIPPRDRARITEALLAMEEDPLAGDVTPLKGPYRGSYRRRVGSWRLIFELSVRAPDRCRRRHCQAHVDDVLEQPADLGTTGAKQRRDWVLAAQTYPYKSPYKQGL